MDSRPPCSVAASLLIAVLAATTAAPPAEAQNHAYPLTVPLRNGGVLHLTDGTWTPDSQDAPNPGSTIYSNTALQGFWKRAPDAYEFGDWGRIPGPTSPAPEEGTHNGYKVTGFKFAYYTQNVRGDFAYTLRFFDSYSPCYGPYGLNEVGTFELDDLPGAPAAGVGSAWTVTVDLSGGSEFCMRSDGGDDYFNNFLVTDSFAWSFTNHSGAMPGGPILAGDPLGFFGPAAPEGDGTIWHGNPGLPGTGLGTDDTLWRRYAGSTSNPTCFNVTNQPTTYASFYMQLYADLEAPPCGSTFSNAIGTKYCDPAIPNSSGASGEIYATGSVVVAEDDFTLWAMDLPFEHNAGYFLMGDGQGIVTPPGSIGPICVSGGDHFVRMLPGLSYTDDTVGGFRRVFGTTGPLTEGVAPGTTWNFQAWHRDGSSSSNTTSAVSIEFQ